MGAKEKGATEGDWREGGESALNGRGGDGREGDGREGYRSEGTRRAR